MAKYLANRDGGQTDEEGIFKFLDTITTGEVISGANVTQQDTPAMGVEVQIGTVLIPSGNDYPYVAWLDAAENVTTDTADVSNPRKDYIVAYIDLAEVDDTNPNNPDAFKLASVSGTPAGSPSEPSSGQIDTEIGASNPYIILALVDVPASDTSITDAQITDRRSMVSVTPEANIMPTGSVLDFAGSSAPTGWLFCYGQAISRTTYAALFAAISTTYGVGDGSTTFNLPDLRGRVVAGKDDMGGSSANRLTDQSGGLDGDTLGDAGGAETHTLTEAQMPAHTHNAGNTFAAGSGVGNVRSVSAGSVATGSTGGGEAHNNVQPTIILNKIIKI